MGWEDLEYGWRLSDHGYHQVIVCNAVYRDNYEYKATWVGRIPDKADWRSYYSARNLILAVRRSRNRPLFYMITAYRLLREGALTLLTKDSKVKRLQLMARGIIDGLRWNDWSGAADRARPSALFQ
jgi:GT2 family glycosyltransferase